MDSPSRFRKSIALSVGWCLAPALLGLLVLFLTRLFREATCETFDENAYLFLGFSIYRRANFTNLASPMAPPLPILLEYGLPALTSKVLTETEGWDAAVPGLIRQARLATSIVVGLPLIFVIYAWLARRRGWWFGALGGALAALSPSILAASSIATTDACFVLFALIALAAIRNDQIRASRVSFLLMGVGLGLALAAKQSAAILFPVALLEILLKSPSRQPGWTGVDFALRLLFRASTRLVLLVFLAFLVDWACYGFGLAPKFGDASTHTEIPVIVPMIANLFPNSEAILAAVRQGRPPLAIDTFLGQMEHAARGHPAFLMGQRSFQGWWYFFPVALGLKSTPSELLMFGAVVYLACRRSTWLDPARRLWLVTLLALLGAGLTSSLNIGHRYMLLTYPLAVLIVVDWIGEWASRRPIRAIVSGLIVLTWQIVSLVGIAPHYLSYFNGLCGGPAEGYRYMVDSSLDWGQDLPGLRRELESRGYRQVALNYFGMAKPASYGIRQIDWLGGDDDDAAKCDWLAISATARQCVYGGVPSRLKPFDDLPAIRVAYSIFLYDLKNPRVLSAWKAARSGVFARLGPQPVETK
jgi:hypothetical protein